MPLPQTSDYLHNSLIQPGTTGWQHRNTSGQTAQPASQHTGAWFAAARTAVSNPSYNTGPFHTCQRKTPWYCMCHMPTAGGCRGRPLKTWLVHCTQEKWMVLSRCARRVYCWHRALQDVVKALAPSTGASAGPRVAPTSRLCVDRVAHTNNRVLCTLASWGLSATPQVHTTNPTLQASIMPGDTTTACTVASAR
jgi:hypothetical protein